mgnify:CR=1 FL=1
MIISNGSGGVYVEGQVAGLFAEYEIIGTKIMKAAVSRGLDESTLREVFEICFSSVMDSLEDVKEDK